MNTIPKPLLVLIALLLSTYTNAQSWKWGRGHEEMGSGSSMATGTATDKTNGVYTVGWYHGTIIFDGDTLNNNNSNGASRGFIVKYDTSGNYQWAKGTTKGWACFLDVATDKHNNVYAVGYYDTSFTFGTHTLINPYTSTDYFSNVGYIFVTKMNSSGNTLWVKNIGNVCVYGGHNQEIEIALDEQQNIYIAANFSDTAIVGSNILLNTTADSATDMLVAKYDSACNPIWAKGFGGTRTDVISGIALSPEGEIYIGGSFHSDTVHFDSYTVTNPDSFTKWHIFLAKLDAGGNTQWVREANAGGGFLWEVATNSTGDAFIGGCYHKQSINFDGYFFPAPPGYQLYGFLVKYNAQGNALWAKNMQAEYTMPLALTTDLCDNIWVQGSVGIQTVTSNDTIDGHVLPIPTNNAWPGFIAGWDTWGTYITGSILPTGYDQHPNGLAADVEGKIYISAETRDIDTFYIGNDPIIISNGIRQMFIAKFDPQTACSTSSISSIHNENSITIYPNPAIDKVNIIAANKIKHVLIRNAIGQTVLEYLPNKEQSELYLAHLSQGIYIITVIDNYGNAITRKLHKE